MLWVNILITIINRFWNYNSKFTTVSSVDDNYSLYFANVNVFVGKNNSGKSTFVRELLTSDFQSWLLDFYFNESKIADLLVMASQYVKGSEVVLGGTYSRDDYDSNPTLRKYYLVNACYNLLCRMQYSTFAEFNNRYERILEHKITLEKLVVFGGEADDQLPYFINTINDISYNRVRQAVNFSRCYIPTLRGIRKIGNVGAPDYYSDRTSDDYQIGHDVEILTGFGLYEKFLSFRNGGSEERRSLDDYQNKLSEYFFDGQNVEIVPRFNTNLIYIKIGSDVDLPIHSLGDGLQQLILLTYRAYFYKEPTLFMVEEPEVHLHAGMLRKLMHFWVNETPQHQYFVTTHSNHLLAIEELRDHINLFKVKKQAGKFTVNPIDKDRSILADLGVQASSVYLANCTIWVEGITDRRYLQTYMRRYLKDLKASEANGDKPSVYHRFVENYHYSFVEYQGGGLAHWDFGTDDRDQLQADVVSPEIFLVADQDIKSKGDRFDRLQESLGDRLYTTPGKEIENMLPDTIVNQVVKIRFKRKGSQNKGGVTDEKVKAVNLAYGDYSHTGEGLGHHIDIALGLDGKGPVDKINRRSPHVFSEESGTVKDKVKFCNEACKLMDASEETWELPQPVKELCEKIFAHIAKHND